MIPRIAPWITGEEIRAAFQARPDEPLVFEREFAAWAEARAAVLFPSAREGLRSLLSIMGASGQEVLLPAYTCAAVPQAIRSAGALPRLLDISLEDYQPPVEAWRAARTARTRAAIPSLLFGLPPAETTRLREALDGLEVIVDLALAPGLRLDRAPAHRLGRTAIYSLNFGKPLTAIQAGFVVTDDEAVAEQVRRERDARLPAPRRGAGWFRRFYLLAGCLMLRPGAYGPVDWLERHSRLLSPLDPLDEFIGKSGAHVGPVEAAVGRCQLRRAGEILARQRAHARLYFNRLAGGAGAALPPDREGAVWSHFPVRVRDADRLIAAFRGRGVAVGAPWRYALSALPTWRACRAAACPGAETAAREVVCLPTLAGLSHETVARIADLWRDILHD